MKNYYGKQKKETKNFTKTGYLLKACKTAIGGTLGFVIGAVIGGFLGLIFGGILTGVMLTFGESSTNLDKYQGIFFGWSVLLGTCIGGTLFARYFARLFAESTLSQAASKQPTSGSTTTGRQSQSANTASTPAAQNAEETSNKRNCMICSFFGLVIGVTTGTLFGTIIFSLMDSTPESAAVGATVGAVLGGVFGLILGLIYSRKFSAKPKSYKLKTSQRNFSTNSGSQTAAFPQAGTKSKPEPSAPADSRAAVMTSQTQTAQVQNKPVPKNPQNPATPPSIAILGLEGSGKTVLMTVLAKKLSETPEEGYYLDPIGTPTIKRVEGTWATLQRGEWPPSTPSGEMFDLHWVLRIKRNALKINADIRLVDLAGQDTRQLFDKYDRDQIQSGSVAPHLKPLAKYLTDASMVLFVLNIKDYIAETDDERRVENQAVLKSALDLLNNSRDVMLVFTQLDQYEDFLIQCGGLEAFCRQYIPYIYNAHIREKTLPTLCVAAVNDTQIKIDEDGNARRVPVPNFSSRGLDKLQQWLVEKICRHYE